jgi:hypothetical protein
MYFVVVVHKQRIIVIVVLMNCVVDQFVVVLMDIMKILVHAKVINLN